MSDTTPPNESIYPSNQLLVALRATLRGGPTMTHRTCLLLCVLCTLARPGAGIGQVLKEYVRLNGSVIAIENPDPIPSLISLSPINGSGPSAPFTGVFSDQAGAASIQNVQFWFSSTGANCHLAYYPASNLIYLDSSADNYTWTGGNGAPGSSGVLTNGVCSVSLASSAASQSGANLTVTASVTFLSYGTYTAYLAATNATGTAGWTSFGSWTAQANNQGAGVYDDRDSRLLYLGGWQQSAQTGPYDSTQSYTQNANASVSFQFYGTTISYAYAMSLNIGYANVYIDGSLVQSNLDGYLAPTGSTANFVWQKLFTYSGLTLGNHTIKVVATGTNDGMATASYVTADAFIVSTSLQRQQLERQLQRELDLHDRLRPVEQRRTLFEYLWKFGDLQFHGPVRDLRLRALSQHGNRQYHDRRDQLRNPG